MSTARPSISPHREHNPVGDGLGAEVKAEGSEDDEPLCRPCVFGMEDGTGEELRASEEEEQAMKVVSLTSPFQPTLSQYLDHCVTHYPYQSWCPHCIEGKGREFGHSTRAKEQSDVPTVSFDYAFLSDGEEILTQDAFDAAGESVVKLLVVRDDRSKALFAHVVPKKGIDEKGFSVDSLVADIKWLGYAKLTLKSDNEPAIVKLLSEALRELRISGMSQILEEHQSDGSA